ncbi:MAG: GntR family transcriptional regulator [Bacteroidota bacterium]
MIDHQSPHPRFYQLYKQIRDRIQAGEYPPLAQIPSQQQLMEGYGVSLITVRRALERLTAEGYITREHGRGCFVAPEPNWLSSRERAIHLGVLVSSMQNSFFPEIIGGMESFLAGKDARLVIAHTRWQAEAEQAYIAHFLDQGCNGLLISPAQDAEAYRSLLRSGVPFIFFNHYYDDPEFSYVVTDDRDGAAQAVRHLLELGHRRIGAVIGGRDLLTASERAEGYRSAMRDGVGDRCEDLLVQVDTFTFDEGREGLLTLLHRRPDLTAVFCSSEILAVGAAAALAERSRRIPQDVSLVAFGDSDTARFFQPTLTTVGQPTAEMGRRAMELLWEAMNAGPGAPSQIRLPCHLIARASTAPPPR